MHQDKWSTIFKSLPLKVLIGATGHLENLSCNNLKESVSENDLLKSSLFQFEYFEIVLST